MKHYDGIDEEQGIYFFVPDRRTMVDRRTAKEASGPASGPTIALMLTMVGLGVLIGYFVALAATAVYTP